MPEKHYTLKISSDNFCLQPVRSIHSRLYLFPDDMSESLYQIRQETIQLLVETQCEANYIILAKENTNRCIFLNSFSYTCQ